MTIAKCEMCEVSPTTAPDLHRDTRTKDCVLSFSSLLFNRNARFWPE